MGKKIMPGTYAWTSPYTQIWMETCYARGFTNLYARRLGSGREFQQMMKKYPWLPQILLVGNFPPDRETIRNEAIQAGINVVHGEDGFFPHYETLHADPTGFCWESSLCSMRFERCSDQQRQRARAVREAILARPTGNLPPGIRKPYVVWPLQLIGDRVNICGLNVENWVGLLQHLRGILPAGYQLVIKPHPRGQPKDEVGIDELARQLPNTLFVSKDASLAALLKECSAVIGANSTVLHEARLIFHKPVYAYAQSWFTNHDELVVPIHQELSGSLPHLEWMENNQLLKTELLEDYADWFLAQLLGRQIGREITRDPGLLQERLFRLSHDSHVKYGEEIFSD